MTSTNSSSRGLRSSSDQLRCPTRAAYSRRVTNGDERGPRYPRVMRRWKNAPHPVTTRDQWIFQAEAAERLNVSVFRIGRAIACENLDPADSPAGEAGVTVASVDRELRWRANATWVAKVRRGIRSSVRWL